MGTTTYWMNVSVDLRIESAAGEDGGGEWMRIGESLHREFNRRARELALDISGRRVYEIMESYWPDARTDATQPAVMREYGDIWTDTPKVLVSNTRTEAQYDTRIVGGDDAIDQLARIIEETDGGIGVGGANVATQLLRHGLLDEILLFVHPVILGAGRPLFDESHPKLELDLAEHATFEDGVVLQRYLIRR